MFIRLDILSLRQLSLQLPNLRLPTVWFASLVSTFQLWVLRFCGFWLAQNATHWARHVRFKIPQSGNLTWWLLTVLLASLVSTFQLGDFWQAKNATYWAKDVSFKVDKSGHSEFAATVFATSNCLDCFLGQDLPSLRPQILRLLPAAKCDMLGKRCKVQGSSLDIPT